MAARAIHDERWEHGSDFDLLPNEAPGTALPASSFFTNATYWHSGRDALCALAAAYPDRLRRFLVPSFYCQDVAIALRAAGREVVVYADSPGAASVDVASLPLMAGDALIVSNTLGLRAASPLGATSLTDVTVVEDHTHDPFSEWARSSNAPFAFASLRKWLPLPDGAVLWSPLNLSAPLPPSFDAAHAACSLERLSGMTLKARYLAGGNVEKATYRTLLVRGEQGIGLGPPGSMSPIARALLDTLPVADLRMVRRANHDKAAAALSNLTSLQVLGFQADARLTPFALTVVLPNARARDSLRAALAAERIFAAVLWPIDPALLPGIPNAHADLARRILSIHCDARYDDTAMDRVVSAVGRALDAAT